MTADRRCRHRALRLLLIAAATATPGLALAVTCTISATTVAFATYSVGSNSDSTGTLTFTCGASVLPTSVTYSIALSTGGSGSYATRKLAAGAPTLNYQLYTNLARTTVWGDGTAGTSVVSGTLSLSPLNPVTLSPSPVVYGRVPLGQTSAVAGSYTDTITVTVTY